jgi:hypothetical protein
MRTTLTIIAALVFTIQILVNISDIFTTPPAGAIDISTIPPEERPDEGTFYYITVPFGQELKFHEPEERPGEGTFYIPIDIGLTVFYIVFLAAGLCLSIAVLLPDKKPKSASLNISEQTQNITALEEKLAIIALVGFSLSCLCFFILDYAYLFNSFKYGAFTDGLKFCVRYTFTIIGDSIAGLCLSVAVLSPYKDTKVATADLRQQAQNIKGMKIKLAIIALVFSGIGIVRFSYFEIVHFSYGSLLELLDGMLHTIPWMLPSIAVLCLSIAVLLPYKELRSTSPVTDQ